MTVSLSVPHPIMRVGPVGSDGPLASITVGALLAQQSSLVSYSIIALSYTVSCSRVRLCVPQSRCFTRDECRLYNVLTHPSSGHVKNRELLTVGMDMASLSKLSSVSVAGCWPLVHLGRTGTKLALAFRLMEGLTSIVTSSHSFGPSNFVHGISFPGPAL